MEPRKDKPVNDPLSVDASLAYELRTRLARKTPAADFTARVMAAVAREATDGKKAPAAVRTFPRPGWVVAGALAASLAAAVFVSRDSVFRTPPPETEEETQLLLSLQLAGEKLNKARDAVLRPPGKSAFQENAR